MHITLEADYAVRIVDILSKRRTRMGAKTIAEETGVTLRFSLKILRKLMVAGVVKSYKGALGGYELAREPEEITLGEVIEIVEGYYSISRCAKEEYICTRNLENECRYNKIYCALSQEVRERLYEVTFSQDYEKQPEE